MGKVDNVSSVVAGFVDRVTSGEYLSFVMIGIPKEGPSIVYIKGGQERPDVIIESLGEAKESVQSIRDGRSLFEVEMSARMRFLPLKDVSK
jgi:hypothetical protein